jgi:lactate dehydrogenase-like 2-hydroxyacid dehydrogenase
VHVTDRIPDRVWSALQRDFDTADDAAGADGILASVTVTVDDAYLDAAGGELKIVANYGVGVNNIDLSAAARRGIVVANTPDVVTAATAELTIALILALLRRIAEGDRLLRRREPWHFSLEFMLGESLADKTLGIIGPGRIGREVARLADAFGARTIFAGRQEPLAPRLTEADIVSVHCPLTEATRHLIDADALAQMKQTAVLVNTARGGIVDEAALVAALVNREIAGAALDVHEYEPSVAEGLLSMENVVLTPHLGSGTRATREAMGMLAVDALRAVLLDKRLPDNRVLPALS